MNKIICEKCGTENEEIYKYCKNCGNILKNESQNEQYNEKNRSEPYRNDEFVESFDGISSEEMSIFIGKKSEKILPKFSKMEITKSKVSWTWPAAILGYILGPMGSALWFFYRKMYKPALIFSLIGAVVMLTTGFMIQENTSDVTDDILNAFSLGNYSEIVEIIGDIGNDISPSQAVLNGLATVIEDFANIGSAIFAGLFGMNIYKKHCINKIKEYKNGQGDLRFYRLGLSAIGGCSGGMLAVGIVIMLAAKSLTEFANIIISFLQ